MGPGDQWNELRPQRLRASPLCWGRRLAWMRRLRHMEISVDSLDALAVGEGVAAHHPLSDRRFWAALAVLPRSKRFQSRTDAMRQFFGELLPEAVLGSEHEGDVRRGLLELSQPGVGCVMAGRGGRRRSGRPGGTPAGVEVSDAKSDARICSFRLPGSIALAQAEVASRSRSMSAAVSSSSQSGGRRSSQAGKAARSSRRAGSRGAIRIPRSAPRTRSCAATVDVST